jgi:hypothetical protein
MPAHEVGKRLKLVRWFDHPQSCDPVGHFRQCSWNGEHQISLRDGEDGRNKERYPECDVALGARNG